MCLNLSMKRGPACACASLTNQSTGFHYIRYGWTVAALPTGNDTKLADFISHNSVVAVWRYFIVGAVTIRGMVKQ